MVVPANITDAEEMLTEMWLWFLINVRGRSEKFDLKEHHKLFEEILEQMQYDKQCENERKETYIA